jgi:hypothetical protein
MTFIQITPPIEAGWRRISLEEGMARYDADTHFEKFPTTAQTLWRWIPQTDFKRRTLA